MKNAQNALGTENFLDSFPIFQVSLHIIEYKKICMQNRTMPLNFSKWLYGRIQN